MMDNLRRIHKGRTGSVGIKALICASVMAGFSLTPAFAQCTLNGSSSPCSLAGPLTVNTYTDTSGSNNITTTSGALTYGSPGTITIFGGFELVSNTSLNGSTGTLTLSNGQIGTNSNPLTLTNGGNLVGSGIIGSNGLTFQNLNLNNSATINANSSGNTLSIQGTGSSIINSGTLEATGGGILTLAPASAAINNSGGNITSTGAGSTVNVNADIQGGTLNTSNGGVLQSSGSHVTLDGSTVAGAITISDGSTYTDATSSTITRIAGTLNLGTTTGGTLSLQGGLELTGNTTVNTVGTGSITLNAAQIGTNSNPLALTNNGLIQGSGMIGSDGLTFQNLNLNNTATINANSSGNTLSIIGTGSSISNSGTLEATGGGILTLATTAAINNSGGNITSTGTGSVVNVNTTIQGGTLNTSGGGVMQTAATGATLDAVSQGAITLSDGSTYTAGASASSTLTRVTGTLNLGTTTGSTLSLGGALELTGNTAVNTPGSGSITMNRGQIGTNSNPLTLTNNGLIQGSGVIGSNGTTFENLSLANNGTINANSNGNTLTIQGTGTSIVNGGTFEATNGGTLTVNTTAVVNNQNGTILATGSGSTVNLSGTIQGGMLTTSSSGVMQTSGTVTLDGSTLGAITLTDGSTYTAGVLGTSTLTNITGQLNLGTVTGSTLQVTGTGPDPGYLRLAGNTTLAGPGTVVLNGGLIGTNSNPFTLTNHSVIQGTGVIGSNASSDFENLNLTNTGTINSNSSGNTLSIQGTGTSIVNTGLLEATNGGTLLLATTHAIDNNGGNITAGTGSTVNVNTTIQGGTLNTLGTGAMQTLAGSTATLDGITNGAITISDGSTYTSGGTTGTLTHITGTLNLGTSTGGTLALSGQLQLTGNTTLSGPGSLTMSSGAQIGTDSNPWTLTNNSTIQGTGLVGSNTGALFQNLSVNNNTGTILANVAGQTLTLGGTGTLTNTGTLQANAGSKLFSSMSGLSSSTFSGGTLLTGTYNIYGTSASAGTIKISALGSSGGEIVNNAATILLNGVNSNFFDGGGLDALSNLADNSGSFSILSGRDFNTPGAFTNTGFVDIGSTSLFSVNGGSSLYDQTAGTTMVDGTLTPGSTDIFGGLLEGVGTVDNSVTVNGGTVAPGDPPGTLNIDGLFDLTNNGDLLIGLAGTLTNQYDNLDVNGSAELNGKLEFDLQNGFNVAAGETFLILESTDLTGTYTVDTSGLDLAAGLTATVETVPGNSNDLELVIGGTSSATPEPSTWLMFAGGLAVFAAVHVSRRRRKCA